MPGPLLFALAFSLAGPAARATDVTTFHNDIARTGQNLQESILTLANVNSISFGKLFTDSLDGVVDAQPLYLSSVTIPAQGTHNLLYVVTENDSVYALDADSGSTLWHVSVLEAGESPSGNHGCSQITPQIGVTSTPVIDRASGPDGTIYVVAMSKKSGTYYQRLHALDLTTGQEEFGGPVTVQATYPGTGDGSQGGNVVFAAGQYAERAGLLLVNHVIYTAWTSHCDARPYTGWLIGYSESTLAQTGVLDVTPNGNEGAIWQDGDGLAADPSGYIYFLDANGTFDTTLTAQGFPKMGDYGNAIVKVSPKGGKLKVADYFNMYNTVSESDADEDLGSGGIMLLPAQKDSSGTLWNLAVGAGKDGNIYIVNRSNLGKFSPNGDSAIYQEIDGVLGGGMWASPAYFGGNVYYGPQGNNLLQFKFSNAKLSTSPLHQSSHAFGYPGTTPSVSANGSQNAIVWAIEHSNPSVLHAYKAGNIGSELYNSNQASGGRDQFGDASHFGTPTIVNGKVYVGTTSGVTAFGLLSGK
ncbi:MAG TPA: PQQ-binding-like beta-propeller repeat protein [Terriglobia bacterium]|nr:PQQ-binding-like beta-propeller repeat protein [Terriglobia bacterium]